MIKLHKTRHPFLRLGKIEPGLWRYFDTSDGKPAVVGPFYATKAEALIDGPRYWVESWGWEG